MLKFAQSSQSHILDVLRDGKVIARLILTTQHIIFDEPSRLSLHEAQACINRLNEEYIKIAQQAK